jgi:hypothetical protein
MCPVRKPVLIETRQHCALPSMHWTVLTCSTTGLVATTHTSRHSCTGWASTTRILQQNDMVLRSWHLLSLASLDSCPKFDTPLQVVQRLVGCGRARVAACPPRRPVPIVHASANRAFCSHTRHCSKAATLVSQMAYCFKFSTKILYELLNHPKRAIHPLHFNVTCAIFCTLLLSYPPQPSQSTNLRSPLFPRPLKLSVPNCNTSSVGTVCSSLKQSYIDCTIHATCFDTLVSSLKARATATVPCATRSSGLQTHEPQPLYPVPHGRLVFRRTSHSHSHRTLCH